MKNYFLGIVMLILTIGNADGQELTLKWKFQTGDKVLSSPTIDANMVYIGSEDGNFYALNSETGQEQWRFKTRGRIQARATVFNDIVFFESDNVFYALNKITGTEKWKHDLKWALWAYKIDPWDDMRSQAIVHNNTFYVGTSLGSLLGLDANSGEVVFEVRSEYGSPIRTTPVIDNDRLYFGDWAGKVYCYSLGSKELIWKKSTYEKKLYDSFGGITSELLVHKNNLYFGGRNPELQVFNARNGEQIWSHTDSTGGWIIGHPIIDNGTLYMGGSDNHKMFAIDPSNGQIKWEFDSKLNVYTKPIVTTSKVIFTVGNAYDHSAPGALFIVDRNSGKFISKFDIPKASFSSPEIHGKTIYFGAYDGYVYAVEMK